MGSAIPAAASKPVIAVIDDDLAVRSSLAFAMEGEGFAVRPYASAEQLLRDNALGEVRCFVIDYKLSGLNGLELIDELRRRNVRCPAVLITTGPSPLLLRDAAAASVPIVEKPLLGDALSQQIRIALRDADRVGVR